MNSLCSPRNLSFLVFGAILVMAVAACDHIGDPLAADRSALSTGEDGLSPEVRRQLATLRNFTAPFHRFEAAQEAGWNIQLTPCLETAEGAQGFHYSRGEFIGDGEALLLEPELLMYEPQKNGRLRLVGVEYIILFSEVPADADPPTLLGQEFHANMEFGLWALHVWLWRHNPNGMFADWNPKVSCQFA